MVNKILLGSSNIGKLKEINFYINHFKFFLGYEVLTTTDFADLGNPTENGNTFEENAKIKSKYFFHLTNIATISDDSGFEVDGLEGYPGIKTARVAKELGGEQKVIDQIFSFFKNKKRLNATFYCALSFIDKEKEFSCLGKVKGTIIPFKKGENGFGYDPFFIPYNAKTTFAEMSENQKMLSSHRKDAFNLLVNQM